MWPKRHITPRERRLAELQNGKCTQRIYWPGGGFTRCAEYALMKFGGGESTGYCSVHQQGASASEMGVFKRLPPPPEPIVKLRTDIDPSGTDEWSDGRFRSKRGRYRKGGKALKMTAEAIYSRRTKRKYRARKRQERKDKERAEALESAACPHCRQIHDADTAHPVHE